MNDSAPGGPRSAQALEELIVSACRRIFERPDVTAADDFFELGGDSLAAVELADRLEDYGEPAAMLDAIFTAASLRELAALLAR